MPHSSHFGVIVAGQGLIRGKVRCRTRSHLGKSEIVAGQGLIWGKVRLLEDSISFAEM